ncbi:TPA: phage portal protein [Escherichia coli]
MKTSTIPTLLGPDGMTSLREYAGYHGGGSGFGGQLRAWNPPSESVDAALLPNFTRGNARADDLVRNNGYAANAIQLHQDHIVGSFFRLSHRPSWRYLGIGEEEARAFSREVEAAWKEFAEDDCCCIDVERKRTFTMMIREGVAMHAFNGELFVQATWDTSSSRLFRTQFRMVSPKRISNPNNTGDTPQVENGPCVSSFIISGTTAATRASDIVTVPIKNNLYNLPFTVLCEVHKNWYKTPNAAPRVFDTGGHQTGAAIILGFGSSADGPDGFPYCDIGGANRRVNENASLEKMVMGMRVKSDQSTCSVSNGRISSEKKTTWSYIQNSATIRIGGQTTAGLRHLFGHIRNFRIWHKALTDAQVGESIQ